MKGMTKALQRTPHNLTSKFGMSKSTPSADRDRRERKFAAIEAASEKMHKDSVVFRDGVTSLLSSGTSFSGSLATLFAPIGNEYNLASKFPQSEVTIKNIDAYQRLMEELKETLQPELDLIESRIVQPSKELNDICKKIRKTCTKRDHKLVDYDRHNNSLNKLRDKKEKSLKDEKNLFKVEQDFELAAGEYEHYNNLLKTELPEFLRMATQFVDPLFHSFYYMQLNVYYIMLEKLQSFTDGKYDLERRDIENVYFEQRGDAGEQLDELGITKRLVTTAKLLQQSRGTPASSRTVSSSSKADLARKESSAGSYASRNVSAPPPYSASSTVGKKAPPPPPPLKPKPGAAPKVYCTAIFDYEAQAAGDLSFSAGDRIEIVERTDSAEDWWTGRLDGRQGIFPGNYTQVD
ncbi:hypothetical protein VHUM_02477 [Vanrija humicola]|uniref:BAR domain-containing protein n=1 Tax=Vanrija humicola TaxID=5417 RepID=A0A7D8Z3B0_VANHU|nr:hypothetical protein VHUM_02477 [Vanrija humicola]